MSESDDRTLSIDEAAPPADSLIRRLSARYLFVLVAVAGLIVVDQLIVQPLLVRLSWYAPVINIAGRQRMLSQRLTKAALTLQAADDDSQRLARRSELGETLAQWSKAQSALRYGNRQLGIPKIQSPEIDDEWRVIEPHFNVMFAAAGQILRDEDASRRDRVATATKTIVEHEAAFLNSMERIVSLMEREAAAAVLRLRFCAAAIATAVVAFLLGLGWFVIRPATRTIRRQVEELESQVALRTRELSAALDELQLEVAERHEAEGKSQRLAAQLAHAARVSTMGHLTAGLAHELNQPLATIANYAEACDVELARSTNGTPVDRLRNYLDHTRQAALRAGQIVRRMRNFLRPNAPAGSVVEIDGLIREVVALLRTEAEHAGVDVSLDLADEHARVAVDPIQIQQVLVNLVQNALQAMRDCPMRRRQLAIRTSVTATGDCPNFSGSARKNGTVPFSETGQLDFPNFVQIDVIDSGPGFDATVRESVFAPFYTTKRDGLGIGLAICRAIVDEHGGTIWAEPASPTGAKVSFTLPLAETRSTVFQPNGRSLHSSPSPAERRRGPAARGKSLPTNN